MVFLPITFHQSKKTRKRVSFCFMYIVRLECLLDIPAF